LLFALFSNQPLNPFSVVFDLLSKKLTFFNVF